MSKIAYIFLLFILINSCIQTPNDVNLVDSVIATKGDVIVLCEGLMGHDNSDISLIKTASGLAIKNFFSNANKLIRLGDTSNDFLIKNDTAFIVSTNGGYIHMVDIRTGKSINVIKYQQKSLLRKIIFINDSIFGVTDLLNNCIVFFNKNSLVFTDKIIVGPNPEGITKFGNLLFTANSAYGDINYHHPNAETISVVDFEQSKEIIKLKAGKNVMEVIVNNKTNKLYASFINLPSDTSGFGGIIEYNLSDFTKTNEWVVNPRSLVISDNGNYLYFINQIINKKSNWKGVSRINLTNSQVENLIENKSNDIWYGMMVDDLDNSIWICNAKNHNQNGEVLVFKENNYTSPLYIFGVGMNPNKISFLR